ncbi:MAG: hypothetical protein AAGD07_13415 [Planctomycetota bacterium]
MTEDQRSGLSFCQFALLFRFLAAYEALVSCPLLAIACLGVLSGVLGCFGSDIRERRQDVQYTATSWRQTPLRLGPVVTKIFPVDDASPKHPSRMFRHRETGPTSVSDCCHLLRRYAAGQVSDFGALPESQLRLALLDDHYGRALFGESVLQPTRFGVRYRHDEQFSGIGESHRDLCLATFAELGLKLSTQLQTDEGRFSIEQLLQESTARFDIKQDEICWTSVAYCLYLPPSKTWRNRFEERFSFDILARELIGRELVSFSCGGAHMLYALTLLLRVDQLTPILSMSTRERVVDRLVSKIREITDAQSESGEWSPLWLDAEFQQIESRWLPSERLLARLVLTGHYLEWMTYLPYDLQPDTGVYRAAFDWLCVVGADAHFERDAVCPQTHAWLAINTLSRVSSADDDAVGAK